ncbi:hypothetical protein XM38_024150 [Halomicronema hongdechloris C2206]|uniref:Uncharacterized protein n=1 Tax=Halomicronema hongdechloris C2206 TaxID=1641165 RepID=A0A1Z3HMD3_9CYAN|nr:hypothetical protein XM38_024150 [Halomicronema hongdechloris C2206]
MAAKNGGKNSPNLVHQFKSSCKTPVIKGFRGAELLRLPQLIMSRLIDLEILQSAATSPMTQAIAPPLNFLEFLETLPDDGNRYELVNGERVQRMATRAHDDVAD